MKKIILLFAALLVTTTTNAQKMGSVLIENGTVLTITEGVKENTDVLIEDGIITAIGENLDAPGDVETVDASGKYVMPGILDAHSHIAAVDINEWTNPVTAEVWMGNVINPDDINIYWALAGGVTTIQLLHGSANVIGGQAETLKLRYGASMEDMRFDNAHRTIKFALGENPMRVHGEGFGVQPSTRMGVAQVIRESFDAALDYKRRRENYLQAKEMYEAGESKNPPVPVAKNIRYEVLYDVIQGDVWVHCHSYRADEILMLMRVFNDYGIENYTFTHGNEAFKVAPELAKNDAMTSIFADWWAYKFEVYYSTAYSATILNENGVTNSINSDSGELIRHLNHEAAKAVHYGKTSKRDALAMITINPAIQLGIDEMVGSIEVGKHGDVAIWSGHPLSIYSKALKTYINGVKYFDRAEDPDDMRLEVNPEVDFDETAGKSTRWYVMGESKHNCLQGAVLRFTEKGMKMKGKISVR